MTDLSEVYKGGRTVVSPRQRVLGMSVFTVGALLVVGAIPLATTDLASSLGLSVFEAREAAGVLAGLGLPAVFVGIFVVLPASNVTRATAAIGASLAIFGVVLFSYAYPYQWISNDPQLALATAALYAAGILVTFWCLFVAVATFKTRNDPGGTARVEITEEGQVRVISKPSTSSGGTPSIPGFGSVGMFGSDPDGTVPTQTNSTTRTQPSETDDAIVVTDSSEGRATSDGGVATQNDPAIENDILESAQERGQPDTYCGNCKHFEYVSVDGEIRPYCGLHDGVMQDMDACQEWTKNN
jgi:hypothetical protein